MNMTPKIGDKFRLLGLVWMVSGVGRDFFQAEIGSRQINLFVKLDADQLDWIKEPTTISKEARDEIVKWAKNNQRIDVVAEIIDKLDSMVRDDDNHDN